MTHTTQGFGVGSRGVHSPEEATSAFLYLGEQLRARRSRGEPSPRARQVPVESAATLLQLVEVEIIPRLMLAHKTRKDVDPSAPAPDGLLRSDDHERFLSIVLNDTATSTRRFVDDLLARGATQETVFLDLLPRAARRLGELWDEDRCDFTDVTLGLCRLHEVVREHSIVHREGSARVASSAPRILLTTACADQHVLGLVLVAEFFRRAGWRVSTEPGALTAQLAAILGEESYDVVGLSAACSSSLDALASEIEALRKASLNRALKILIGGRLVLEMPELVSRIGADGSADDARSAPVTAFEMLPRTQRGADR